MKRTFLPSLMSVLACFAVSCTQSDFDIDTYDSTPQEADIKYVRISDASILKYEADTLHDASKFVVEDLIEIPMNSKADLTRLAPRFVLTQGSHIYMKNEATGNWDVPADGVARDFSKGELQYMVVSRDGSSHHLYSLAFNCNEVPNVYHLDWYEEANPGKKPNYYIFKEYDTDGNAILTWCTANPGFGISKRNAEVDDYPTTACEGWNGEGHGVQLRTLKTGTIGASAGKPIAAGNLFLGDFNVVTALSKPLESTRFGVPYNKKPLYFNGYMNYVPEKEYTDAKLQIVPNMADSCSIYAVLYKNTNENGEQIMLDGSTIDNSPYIVARAEVLDARRAGTNGAWSYFTVEFKYDYPLAFDPEVAKNNGYNITLVASSSCQGAFFKGAVGSTLKVDEFELIGEEVK